MYFNQGKDILREKMFCRFAKQNHYGMFKQVMFHDGEIIDVKDLDELNENVPHIFIEILFATPHLQFEMDEMGDIFEKNCYSDCRVDLYAYVMENNLFLNEDDFGGCAVRCFEIPINIEYHISYDYYSGGTEGDVIIYIDEQSTTNKFNIKRRKKI